MARFKIDGVWCDGTSYLRNRYYAVFSDKLASKADIKAINWASPTYEDKSGTCTLPIGYGFKLEELTYKDSTGEWKAELSILRQYWGDTTPYQTTIDEQKSTISDLQSVKTELTNLLAELDLAVAELYEQKEELEKQLAETDEALAELYESTITDTTVTGEGEV